MKISLARVEITSKIRENIETALREGMIGGGRFIQEFEKKFAEYIGTKYAVFVANGTLADTLAVAAVADGRNEVIIPALTFVAQPNAVIHAGLKPVFVDVDERGQIDPSEIKARINENTLAIFATHLLGRVADLTELRLIAAAEGVYLLEDCCEALGAEGNGKKVGSFGDIGSFYFYASDHMSTGEGGMCTTNDEKIYRKLVSLRNHGRKSDAIEDVFTFEYVGFNAKGTNLQAAIGLGLLGGLDEAVRKRRKNLAYLGGWWFPEIAGEYASPHCFPTFSEKRDRKIRELFEAGIEARKLMACIPNPLQCPAYRFLEHKEGDFPKADFFGAKGLYVPCHQFLTEQGLDYLIKNLEG